MIIPVTRLMTRVARFDKTPEKLFMIDLKRLEKMPDISLDAEKSLRYSDKSVFLNASNNKLFKFSNSTGICPNRYDALDTKSGITHTKSTTNSSKTIMIDAIRDIALIVLLLSPKTSFSIIDMGTFNVNAKAIPIHNGDNREIIFPNTEKISLMLIITNANIIVYVINNIYFLKVSFFISITL